LFIRGDDAIALLHEIREVQKALAANNATGRYRPRTWM
jgi:hypothetical protein